MNRKQKIIVSVTGLFLVLLILLGLTYAYFLTRITGNDKEKSIGISTANLALVYGDDDGSIIGDGEIIKPGTTFETKTFTVTNQGNEKTGYVVVIEDVKVEYAETIVVDGVTQTKGETTTFESNDFIYTLKCESGCNGVEDAILPMEDGILIGNTIEVGETQTYSFTLTYKYTEVNQSSDMNKVLSGRLNIEDINKINPYSENTNTLAYNIINNAIKPTEEEKGLGYAELVASPPTKVAQEISGEDESVLSIAHDDYGISYYYRGNVENNYITFAEMCWRIVRIEGKGSIKLMLEDQDQVCGTSINGNWAIPTTTSGSTYTGDFGYIRYNIGKLIASDGTTNSSIKYVMDYLHGSDRSMATAFKNFQNTFSTEELNKLKVGDWCLADKGYDSSNNLLTSAQMLDNKVKGISFTYDSYFRLYGKTTKEPTLRCYGIMMDDWDDDTTSTTSMYVGAMTADEVVYAGGKVSTSTFDGAWNQNYYLINDEFKKGANGVNKTGIFRLLSPSNFDGNYDYVFTVEYSGRMPYSNVYGTISFRPTISLATSTVITGGNGTIDNPYIVD